MKTFDIVIIGGGPGGSTLAALLAKKSSYSVAIIEKESYPRFHIGESLLPSTMPIFKETGFYDKLSSGKYIQKYGASFVDYRYPEEIYFGFQDGFNPDIPSAFEVPRGEFDKDILEHARELGTQVFQPEKVRDIEFFDDHVKLKTGSDEYRAKFVVDASGRDSVIGKRFCKRKAHTDLNNVAVFAHYTGIKRGAGEREGDIRIALLPENAWAWIIPFKGERTSVGVVCSSKVFRGGADLGDYIDTALSASPHIKEMMSGAVRETEVSMIANYSHGSDKYVGDRWLAIGDAAVFLDPIFSSGVHVSCMSAKLAAPLLMSSLETNSSLLADGKAERYAAELDKGVGRFHKLISLFYETNFVLGMQKTLTRENVRKGFTSAVAGDMWNDENFIFKMNVL